MKQLKIGISSFPDLFICKDDADIALAQKHGLPYLVWKDDDHDKLIKLVLFHIVSKQFPEIDWAKAWGLTKNDLEFCRDGNVCVTGGDEETEVHEYNIDDYLVSNDAKVNIEELEGLHLLPKFLSDIADCIRTNITDYTWKDGLNKKTGLWIGNYIPQEEARNLIILDISHSIPVGISSVMLRLIDTIRHKCDADLIVTGMTSYFWSIDEELPTPQQIRDKIPRSNESEMFQNILRDRIAGKHWGHIISFGDDDCPTWSYAIQCHDAGSSCYAERYKEFVNVMQGTEIEMVHHYYISHGRMPKATGYAWWTKVFNPKEEINTTWADVINERY